MKSTGESVAYVDTSALIKAVLPEPESAQLDLILRSRDVLLVSDLCITETASVLMRKVRKKELTADRARECYQQIRKDVDAGVYRRVDLTAEMHREAESMILKFGDRFRLISSDALHLIAAERNGAGELITYDSDLAHAVRSIGTLIVSGL